MTLWSNCQLLVNMESSKALFPNQTRQSHSAIDILVERKTEHKVPEMSSKTDDVVM